MQRWDIGSIPSPAQQVKDLVLPIGDLIPGLGTPYMSWGGLKRKKKKNAATFKLDF